MDKYLMPIPGPVNSQGFARDTASTPPGIFHNSKFADWDAPDIFPGYAGKELLQFRRTYAAPRTGIPNEGSD
jgi:hypothetical protein